MLGIYAKADKARMLDEHKVKFVKGHAVWGVTGIPDPDWEDLKWLIKRQKVVARNLELKDFSQCRRYVWRTAKLLEERLNEPEDQRLDLNQKGGKIINDPFYSDPRQSVDTLKTFLELFTSNQKIKPFKWLCSSDFDRLLDDEYYPLIEFMVKEDILHTSMVSRLVNYKRKKEKASIDKKNLRRELKKMQGQGNTSDEDGYIWQKISDHKVSQKISCQDGSSIKYIFDFAAGSVKTIEREPGEHPATFETEFAKASSYDLEAARQALLACDGDPDLTKIKPTKKVAPPPQVDTLK